MKAIPYFGDFTGLKIFAETDHEKDTFRRMKAIADLNQSNLEAKNQIITFNNDEIQISIN